MKRLIKKCRKKCLKRVVLVAVSSVALAIAVKGKNTDQNCSFFADMIPTKVCAQEEMAFTDVAQNKWSYNAVCFVFQRGLMVGKGDGIFAPEDSITRAEFVTVLYNKEGKPATDFQAVFSDVQDSKWYTAPILWAYQQKLVKGYGDTGVFGVSDEITREQLAQILYSYAKNNDVDLAAEPTALAKFGDSEKVSGWAVHAMRWAVTRGVLNGSAHEVPLLNPLGKTTRAECAALIKNFIEKGLEDKRPEAGEWSPDIM